MLVCSSGGHLVWLYHLKPWWERYERVWVTFEKRDSVSLLEQEEVEWAHHPTTRNVGNLVRNFVLALKLFRRHRPDLIVSSGAGVAFPFFIVARLHRVRTVFVESFEHVDLPTLTGRLCYPLADVFLLQWDDQKRFYPRGQVIGKLA
jgi:beta-1,4-N-acetylglucosaminyltransferase